MRNKVDIIRDEDLQRDWKEIVRPYCKQRKVKGTFERKPRQRILYEHMTADEPKATVVLVHGFTESLVKFYETCYYFLANGYNVWLIQQRGHGVSYRNIEDVSLVHITDYNDLVDDLDFFIHELVIPGTPEGQPLYIYGHSMGGGVAAIYLERYPEVFSKAILNAPMMEIDSAPIPVWLAKSVARVMIAAGKGNKYMPGSKPFSDDGDFENSCTTCRERYDQYLALAIKHDFLKMSALSISTAMEFFKLTQYVTKPENTARVKAKVLLFQAGKDNMVLPGGQERFVKNIPGAELVRIEDAKHEIYRCGADILVPYWEKILEFLES